MPHDRIPVVFVLVDGWRLISGSLVESYMHGPPPG